MHKNFKKLKREVNCSRNRYFLVWKQLLHVRDKFKDAFTTSNNEITWNNDSSGNFKNHDAYDYIIGHEEKAPWYKLVWEEGIISGHAFYLIDQYYA